MAWENKKKQKTDTTAADTYTEMTGGERTRNDWRKTHKMIQK